MNVQSRILDILITQAEISQKGLDRLNVRLAGVAEIAARENMSLSGDKEKLLSTLWTVLGGNRKDLRRYDNNLSLLDGLGKYTLEARKHVYAALVTLRGMKAEMKEMRLRVATPDIVGSLIPVEVHMRSIKEGLSRLRRGKNDARHLEETMIKQILAHN